MCEDREDFTFAGCNRLRKWCCINEFCRGRDETKRLPYEIIERNSNREERFYTFEEREARWEHLKELLKPVSLDRCVPVKVQGVFPSLSKWQQVTQESIIQQLEKEVRELQHKLKEAEFGNEALARFNREFDLDKQRLEKQLTSCEEELAAIKKTSHYAYVQTLDKKIRDLEQMNSNQRQQIVEYREERNQAQSKSADLSRCLNEKNAIIQRQADDLNWWKSSDTSPADMCRTDRLEKQITELREECANRVNYVNGLEATNRRLQKMNDTQAESIHGLQKHAMSLEQVLASKAGQVSPDTQELLRTKGVIEDLKARNTGLRNDRDAWQRRHSALEKVIDDIKRRLGGKD